MRISEIFSLDNFGQGFIQLDELVLAFVLSSLIGLEREIRQRSAGLRTHTIVGLGAALIMLVSKYGFSDVIALDHVVLDPSRIAAQIVSGIGFIGGGLIFVRKDIVHGLTTAATIWLTAGIGMACGGNLPVLAVTATIGHFVVVFGYTLLMRQLVGSSHRLIVRYHPGRETATKILGLCAAAGFTVRHFSVKSENTESDSTDIILDIQGKHPLAPLVEKMASLPDVILASTNCSREE